jgi:type IV pilus assembly protein PilW
MTHLRFSHRHSQSGLSLVELMVALLVGMILLGGLIQVYLSNKQSYNAQEQLARMQEGGRFAMELITRDLRRSGYWGGNVDLRLFGGSPGVVEPPSPPVHACDPAATAWGRMIGWRVSGLNNSNAGYTCATGYQANTDILTVRYAGPEIVDFASIPADDGLYFLSELQTFLGRVITGALKDDNLAELPTPTPPAHLAPVARPLRSHGYYVGASGRTCPGGQAIPALRRVRLDPTTGLPTVTEEIASGVEQLQVRYLLNEAYVDATAVDAAPNGWRDVSAVRVWLLVRAECPEPDLVNDANYVMGDIATWPAAPDNYRRQLYVSTVMLRNNVVR